MHIQRVEISNIKGLRSATLEFGVAPLAGWHVVLGDNGSGKTTIIRAIAAALVGPQDVAGLRVDWEAWFGPDKRTPRGRGLARGEPDG
jgi:DNA repair exonuclease SbcCD ATPase subunit